MSNFKNKSTYKDIQKIQSMIANDPSMDSAKLLSEVIKMGYENPGPIIDAALGSIKIDKSGAPITADITDILNQVYADDPTPGKRYVVNPYKESAIGTKAKSVIKNLQDEFGDVDQGVALRNTDRVKGRAIPKYLAIPDPSFYRDYYNLSDELSKLLSVSAGGHEIKHGSDWLIYPNFDPKVSSPHKEGHHAKGIYETDELIRESRDLPVDKKTTEEIAKQSKKLGIKPSLFTRLLSYGGFIGPAVGAGLALKSGDTLAAALHGAAAIDPVGVADAVLDVKNRIEKRHDPEFSKETAREDKYNAMGHAMSPSDTMLDQLEDIKEKEDKDKKMKDEEKFQILNKLLKDIPKGQKLRSQNEMQLKEEIQPIVQILGDPSAIKEKDALRMSGEKLDQDVNSLSVEDSEREMKKKLYGL